MLLPIMELAFKSSNEVKVRAFQAWQVLIDNFATNYGKNIIAQYKDLIVKKNIWGVGQPNK